MTKICGYNCEHNKGGICQITYCDKIGKMTTTTQEIEVLTRWQDPTIKEKDKEIERLKSEIDKMKMQEEHKEMHNHSKNVRIEHLNNEIKNLKNIIDESIEDISFCLHSITQEKIGSRDSRTRQEMSTCEYILRERLDKLKEGK